MSQDDLPTDSLQWSIGDVIVTAIPEIDIVADCTHMFPGADDDALKEVAWLSPHFVDEDWRLKFRFQAFLLRTPTLRIIVDTCFGNDKVRPRTGNMLKTDFISRLKAANFDPDQIDIVLCTHLHLDHVGWNTKLDSGRWVPTFPNARYLFARKEYEHWSEADDPEYAAIMDDSVRPVVDAGLVDLVEMDHRICDEVRLVPSPGHTPGHVSGMISSKGEEAIVTGDFVHHPIQLAKPHWYSFVDSDAALATATRREMWKQLAASKALVIGTHFMPPTAGRIAADGSEFKLE